MSAISQYPNWDKLQQLTDDVAADIELWDGKVVWARRGPLEHQHYVVRMFNALEAEVRRAMRDPAGAEQQCWQAGVLTKVFFAADKSSFLTPDFLVRRRLPRGADTTAADVVLVGEVLFGPYNHRHRLWKMDRYADAGIPWYWEIELDSDRTWDIKAVTAYGLMVVPAARMTVKPLRPTMYVPVGEWEPTGPGIDFPEPFNLHIDWDDLAF